MVSILLTQYSGKILPLFWESGIIEIFMEKPHLFKLIEKSTYCNGISHFLA